MSDAPLAPVEAYKDLVHTWVAERQIDDARRRIAELRSEIETLERAVSRLQPYLLAEPVS